MLEKKIVQRLTMQVDKLIAGLDAKSEQCRSLIDERDRLQGENHRLQREVRDLKTRIRNLELANGLQGDSEAVEGARARINLLLREVDRCIAILTQEQENKD